MNGSAALVDLLLKSGAKPNLAIATGETPLMTCAKSGNVEAVRTLIAHDAAINAKEPVQNQTALMWAAAEHHPAVVKALIDANADLQAHSKKGYTALHFAAREGDQESVRLLLAAGVNVNIRTQPEVADAEPGADGLVAAARPHQSPRWIVLPEERVDGGLHSAAGGHGARRGRDWRYSCWIKERTPTSCDAGFTPLHWASTTWESFTANPVYGFEDPMAGIPDRQAKLQFVKALLAHGANPNARMTKTQPTFAGGYHGCGGRDAVLAREFSRRSRDDEDAAGGGRGSEDGPTATNTTAMMAATGAASWGRRESGYGGAGSAAMKFLLDLGVDAKGATMTGENALFGPAYRGWNTLLGADDRSWSGRERGQQGGRDAVACGGGQGDRLGGVLYNKDGADLLLKHGADPKLGHPCEAQNKCGGVMRQGAFNSVAGSCLLTVFRLHRTTPARELVTKYCVSCHNQKLRTANLVTSIDDVKLGRDVGKSHRQAA